MNLLTKIDPHIFNTLKLDFGEDFLEELLETFYNDSNQQLESMQTALEEENSEDFTRAAHSLKSTSLTFGASAFGALARELEMLSREGNLEASREKFQQLYDASEPLFSELKDMCHASENL